MNTVYNTNSIEEFYKVANLFSNIIKKGDIISLKGTLGSGKTTFVQKVVSNFDKNFDVCSPTFSIVNEYKNIIHIDAYKLYSYEDFLDDYLINENIVFIEWFENLNITEIILNWEIEFIVVSEHKRQIRVRRIYENTVNNTSS